MNPQIKVELVSENEISIETNLGHAGALSILSAAMQEITAVMYRDEQASKEEEKEAAQA